MANRKYSDDFKEEAVKQVRERGYPVPEVAKRIGISAKSLYQRVRASRGDTSTVALDAVGRLNLRLKADLGRAEEERDVPRMAAASLARVYG